MGISLVDDIKIIEGSPAEAVVPKPRDKPDKAPPEEKPVRARWWRGDFATAFVVAVGWQVALTLVGTLVERAQNTLKGHPDPNATLLTHTVKWDGGWFTKVLKGAYAFDPQAPAFYPLFPFSVWLVDTISFGLLGFVAAGFVVNLLSTWFAVTALRKIMRHFVDSSIAGWLAVAVFLTVPPAFFMHVFYSEALFVALGFWAYRFALARQWWGMIACLIPMTACRITAVLFVALCFLEFWRSRNWRLRGLFSPWVLLFPLSALGFMFYAIRMKIVRDDPFAMFAAYKAGKDWFYHVFEPNIFVTIGTQAANLAKALNGESKFTEHSLVDLVLPFGALAVLLACSVYAIAVIRGPGIPLGVFGLASFVMFTLNSNLVSVHRYVLPCVVVYVALAHAAERFRIARPAVAGIMFTGALLQGMLFMLFVLTVWAG